MEQLKADREWQFLIPDFDVEEMKTTRETMNAVRGLQKQCQTIAENNQDEMEMAWDDVSGAELNPAYVKKARREEIEYVRKMNLYDKVPISECYRVTGKSPISVRWININKGDKDVPNYRPRLGAREMNTHKRDDLFAATPPLGALNTILLMTATSNNGELIMINDASRAFFHAKAKRPVFVQLAKEGT